MTEALIEETDSMDSTFGNPGEKYPNIDLRISEFNIEQLRILTRSLENLAEETMYSKWKRTRDVGTLTTPRSRNISSMTTLGLAGRKQSEVPGKRNSFHVLQENVFRPRY